MSSFNRSVARVFIFGFAGLFILVNFPFDAPHIAQDVASIGFTTLLVRALWKI